MLVTRHWVTKNTAALKRGFEPRLLVLIFASTTSFLSKRQIQYSFCVCDEALGYQGYGCTEKGPNAPSQLVLVLNVVLLIGSNVAFLGAIVLACRSAFAHRA